LQCPKPKGMTPPLSLRRLKVSLFMSVTQTPLVSKIDSLRGTVEGLIPVYEELTEEQIARRKFDEERVIKEKQKSIALNEKLEVEIVARSEADLALEKLCQTSLNTRQVYLTKPIETGLQEVKEELDAAHQRLTDAEEALARNVQQSEEQLAALRIGVVTRLDMFKVALAKEVETRKVADDDVRATFPHRFKELRATYLEESRHLDEEAHKIRVRCRALETSEASLEAVAQNQIRAETKALAEGIQREKTERIERLVEVSTRIDEYSVALTHGLKIVNRSDP